MRAVTIKTKPCLYCAKTSDVEVDLDAYDAWKRGKAIQDAFPDWTPEKREMLMTGTHPECWNAMFPDEDEGP